MEIILHTAESNEMLRKLARTTLHQFQRNNFTYHRFDYNLICHGVHFMVCVRTLVHAHTLVAGFALLHLIGLLDSVVCVCLSVCLSVCLFLL